MPADPSGGWDVHTHLVPATVVTAAQRGRFGMEVEGDLLVTPSLRFPMRRITDPAALTAWLDEQDLAGALVSPPPPLYRPDLDDAEIKTWVSLVNEGLAQTCADDGLRPMAYVPVERPRLATEIVADLDDTWVGVTLGTELGGLVYSDPAFDPLWDVLAARSLPAFLHPGQCPDPRLQPFYLTNLLGNPLETTVAVAHLVFADVPARFPGLRILLAHGGGLAPALVGRWERGVATDRPGLNELTLTPREALARFWADTVVHDPSYLRHVIATFGAEHVLFGSDWPFPMGAASVESSLEGLSSVEGGAVLMGNIGGLLL